MKADRQLEDSSSQAGWMFADLFLALTVIFLATVSFIPSGKSSSNSSLGNSNSTKYTSSIQSKQVTLISNGFIGDYKVADVDKFKSDLQTYLKQKDLPSNTSALYLEVIGHTKDYGVPNDSGNLEAIKFVINARKSMPENFAGTNSSINLSPAVALGNVKIKVTFI